MLKNATIQYISNGHGDMIIVKTPTGKSVIIDWGALDKTLEKKDWIKHVPGNIDALILTHNHDDHNNLLAEIPKPNLKNTFIYKTLGPNTGNTLGQDQTRIYQVIKRGNAGAPFGAVSRETNNTQTATNFQLSTTHLPGNDDLKNAIPVIPGDDSLWIVAAGSKTAIPPPIEPRTNPVKFRSADLNPEHTDNAASMCIYFELGKFRYLFTGDATKPVIRSIPEALRIGLTGIHIPHHASDENTVDSGTVNAQFGIFTAAKTGDPGTWQLPKKVGVDTWAESIKGAYADDRLRKIRMWRKLTQSEIEEAKKTTHIPQKKAGVKKKKTTKDAQLMITKKYYEQGTKNALLIGEKSGKLYTPIWGNADGNKNIFSTMNGNITIEITHNTGADDEMTEELTTYSVFQDFEPNGTNRVPFGPNVV